MPLDELNRLIAEAGALLDDKTSHRYNLIRRMARRYSERSRRQVAIRMAKDLKRYQQARWEHDGQKSESEIEYQQGGKSEYLYKIMKATKGRPLSSCRIEEILAGRKCGQ